MGKGLVSEAPCSCNRGRCWPRLDAILQEVPRPQRLEVPVDIQPHELRAALRSMRKKAEGPELWGAEALLALAQQWWREAARLWRSVLREGSPLAAWLRGKTVFLYKASGKTRPITILPFIWRCGAKLVNRQLTNWCMSWKTHHDAGGLPTTCVGHALQQLRLAMDQGSKVFVQQDVAQFFDSLGHAEIRKVLVHLEAPAFLLKLFEGLCARGARILSSEFLLDTPYSRSRPRLPAFAFNFGHDGPCLGIVCLAAGGGWVCLL